MPKPLSLRPGQGDPLEEFTKRIANRAAGYYAAHLRLSKLPEGGGSEAIKWLAENTFGRLVQTYNDEFFSLANGDLVVISRNAEDDTLNDAIDRICALAMRDLTLAHQGPDQFAACYDLGRAWADFMSQVEPLFQKKRKITAAHGPEDDDSPIDVDHLNTLQDALRAADMSNYVRRQTICAVIRDEPIEPVYDELFISVRDLREDVMPNVDLAANQLLFRQLTNTFDSRMLSILNTSGKGYLGGPCALNLNVATVLSPGFLDLTNYLGVGRDQALIVELQIGDVFGNLKDFYIARDVAREIGCRLCLDGIDYRALLMLDFASLGFQLYKFQWHDELTYLPAHIGQDLKDAILRAGRERLIMCRAGDKTALNFGLAHGISLYQGWHIDKALANRPKPRPQKAPVPA